LSHTLEGGKDEKFLEFEGGEEGALAKAVT